MNELVVHSFCILFTALRWIKFRFVEFDFNHISFSSINAQICKKIENITNKIRITNLL